MLCSIEAISFSCRRDGHRDFFCGRVNIPTLSHKTRQGWGTRTISIALLLLG
jgi:hypothetical protein